MKGLLSHFAVYGYSSMDCGCELPLVFLLDVCFRVSDDNVIEAIFWRVCKGVCVSGCEGGGGVVLWYWFINAKFGELVEDYHKMVAHILAIKNIFV